MMDVFHETFFNQEGSLSDEFDDLDESEQQVNYRSDSVFCIPKSTDRREISIDNREMRKFETYQNQRVWMGIFKEVLFPHERAAWSDKEGTVKLPRESILLPAEGNWQWESGW